MQMVMTSNKLKSKFLYMVQCHMQNAWQRTTGKIQNIMSLRTAKNCPVENSWPNHAKNEQHIASEKTYSPPQILDSLNTLMQRTANKNAAGLRRNCKRSRVLHVTRALRTNVIYARFIMTLTWPQKAKLTVLTFLAFPLVKFREVYNRLVIYILNKLELVAQGNLFDQFCPHR